MFSNPRIALAPWLASFCLVAPLVAAPPLRILSWNVESEGADPDVIAEELQNLPAYHIYALSEVKRTDLRRFTDAIGNGKSSLYRNIHSATGHHDRLEIIFDTARLELLEARELFVVRNTPVNDEAWHHRSPLVAKFRDKQWNRSFLLVLNHLARGDAVLRATQAEGLTKWASAARLPVIAVGDFNFDYVFATRQGNAAFDVFLRGDTWKWIRPLELVDTNWADFDEDGEDDYPGSMLDFVFTAGAAKKWSAASQVIVRRGDFPDDESTSDHRPVELVITPTLVVE